MEYTLTGGTVIDGTGIPGYRADLSIKDGIITAIASDLPRNGTVIEIQDQVVCPGFIDMHSHTQLFWMADPRMEAKTRQGITTEVTGPDGYSAAPIRPADVATWRIHLSGIEGDPADNWSWSSFSEYRKLLRNTSCNWAPQVGHGNLRLWVMGMQDRKPTEAELQQMGELLDQSLKQGAYSFTTGLVYTPQAYADFDELVSLCRVAAKNHSFLTIHIRTQHMLILQGLQEALDVARKSGCSLHISHFQLSARGMWGKVDQCLELIEAARKEGVEVTCDSHPYTAGSTTMAALMPPWAHSGGPEQLLEVLKSSSQRLRLERDALEGLPTWESRFKTVGTENIYVSSVKTASNQSVVGRNLVQLSEEWGITPFQAVVKLLQEENLAASIITMSLSESDVEQIMRLPWQMFCSDALLIGKPHPRAFGTYPRIFKRYVRDKKVLTLEEAVKKCTSVPASRLGLKDRGILSPGKAADLVIFDPLTIEDKATYDQPRQYPDGINYVFVNGTPVVSAGDHTNALPGQAL
jgi:N-acyl-D-amino-acid deacylase